MQQETYVFDIIVTKIKADGQNFSNPKDLTVSVKCCDYSIAITSSRLLIHDFHPQSGIELRMSADELQYNLKNTPIKFSVRYDGEFIGTAVLTLPENVLQQINENMLQITHSGICELKQENGKMGMLKFSMRIQQQGRESSQDISESSEGNEFLFFIGGDSKDNPEISMLNSCICNNFEEDRDEYVNLSKINTIDGQVTETVHMPSTAINYLINHLNNVESKHINMSQVNNVIRESPTKQTSTATKGTNTEDFLYKNNISNVASTTKNKCSKSCIDVAKIQQKNLLKQLSKSFTLIENKNNINEFSTENKLTLERSLRNFEQILRNTVKKTKPKVRKQLPVRNRSSLKLLEKAVKQLKKAQTYQQQKMPKNPVKRETFCEHNSKKKTPKKDVFSEPKKNLKFNESVLMGQELRNNSIKNLLQETFLRQSLRARNLRFQKNLKFNESVLMGQELRNNSIKNLLQETFLRQSLRARNLRFQKNLETNDGPTCSKFPMLNPYHEVPKTKTKIQQKRSYSRMFK